MIHRTVRQFRVGGCAGRMAEEFGGHPDSAARRMRQLARRPGLGMSRWPEDNGWQSAGKLPGRQRNKGIAMPWFPGFINAAELARRQTRAACQADPVARYITALNKGDIPVLENVRPGEMVVYDTRAGEIRGHKQLRRFVSQNQSWLAGRHARIETVASTCAGGR